MRPLCPSARAFPQARVHGAHGAESRSAPQRFAPRLHAGGTQALAEEVVDHSAHAERDFALRFFNCSATWRHAV